LARMPPVQPRPTMTTSTCLSFVTMSALPSAHIGDADWLLREFPPAIFLDVVVVHGERAGEADHPPPRLVTVAAIHRVGEHAFHDGLIDDAPKRAGWRAIVEGQLARRQAEQHLLALRFGKPIERLVVGLAAMGVGCRDAR